MKLRKSIRRVANTLLTIGVLALSLITVSQIATICPAEINNCMVASVYFGPASDTPTSVTTDVSASVSTPSYSPDNLSMASFIFSVIQITSVYLILLGVVLLILLETRELFYLKKLVNLKKT